MRTPTLLAWTIPVEALRASRTAASSESDIVAHGGYFLHLESRQTHQSHSKVLSQQRVTTLGIWHGGAPGGWYVPGAAGTGEKERQCR